MTVSVVRNIAAVETAFSSATLKTFAGSMIPAAKRSLNDPSFASKPKLIWSDSFTFSTTRSPLKPALSAICFTGYWIAFLMISIATCSSGASNFTLSSTF